MADSIDNNIETNIPQLTPIVKLKLPEVRDYYVKYAKENFSNQELTKLSGNIKLQTFREFLLGNTGNNDKDDESILIVIELSSEDIAQIANPSSASNKLGLALSNQDAKLLNLLNLGKIEADDVDIKTLATLNYTDSLGDIKKLVNVPIVATERINMAAPKVLATQELVNITNGKFNLEVIYLDPGSIDPNELFKKYQ